VHDKPIHVHSGEPEPEKWTPEFEATLRNKMNEEFRVWSAKPGDDRTKKSALRQLRLLWHPDKHAPTLLGLYNALFQELTNLVDAANEYATGGSQSPSQSHEEEEEDETGADDCENDPVFQEEVKKRKAFDNKYMSRDDMDAELDNPNNSYYEPGDFVDREIAHDALEALRMVRQMGSRARVSPERLTYVPHQQFKRLRASRAVQSEDKAEDVDVVGESNMDSQDGASSSGRDTSDDNDSDLDDDQGKAF